MPIPNPQPHAIILPHADQDFDGLSNQVLYDGDWTYDDVDVQYTNGEIVSGLNKPRTV